MLKTKVFGNTKISQKAKLYFCYATTACLARATLKKNILMEFLNLYNIN